MLKGIIFDMDGTITLTETLHYRAFAQVFKKFGIDYSLEEHIAQYVGSGAENIFTKVFEDRGLHVSKEEFEKAVLGKRELYAKLIHEEDIPVVPGIEEFVERIHSQGLKKIIATGNSSIEPVRYLLEKIGLSEYFPEILSIAEVKHGKPAPDVFLEALRRLGLLASECVVLEDAINGVLAAQAAGIRSIAFDTTASREDLLKAGVEAVLKDYSELTDEILAGKST